MCFTLWAFSPAQPYSVSVSRLLLFPFYKETKKKEVEVRSTVRIIIFSPKRSTELKEIMLVTKEYFGGLVFCLF